MHSFLKSIGFSDLEKDSDLYNILDEVVYHPDESRVEQDAFGNKRAFFAKYVSTDVGLAVCGCFLEAGRFRLESYYPFFKGSNITTKEPVDIEDHKSNTFYYGVCEEFMLGIPLIFFINNPEDIFHEKQRPLPMTAADNTVISGLGHHGKILLPVMKSDKISARKQRTTVKRMQLIQKAKAGNHDAMENLTLNDMDQYAVVSQRALHEDILSIVESSIMPYGIECDQYIVIGEILSVYHTKNTYTNETIWIMTLVCNDLTLDVCINEKNLLGEPMVGRRFKGRIWMQGHLNFGY